MSLQNKFQESVGLSMRRSNAIIRSGPLGTAAIIVGFLLFPAKGVEGTLLFDRFSDPLRDGRGDLTSLEWWWAMGLTIAVLIASTFSIHMLLSTLSKSTVGRLGVGMGIAALLAVAVNPLVSIGHGDLPGQNSISVAASDEAQTAWGFWLLQLPLVAQVVLCALVAGLGIGFIKWGWNRRLEVRQAKEDLLSGEGVLLGVQTVISNIETRPDRENRARTTMTLKLTQALSTEKLSEADHIEAYVYDRPMLSKEEAQKALNAEPEEPLSVTDPEMANLIEVLCPPRVNLAVLPAYGRLLSPAAKAELLSYSAHLRRTFSPENLLKELTP